MSSIRELMETIKLIALNAVAASYPVQVMYATVESEAPLALNIQQGLTLKPIHMVLAERLSDHSLNATLKHQTGKAGEPKHVHECDLQTTVALHNSLKVGDKVVVLQVQGGQKFIVLDKIAPAGAMKENPGTGSTGISVENCATRWINISLMGVDRTGRGEDISRLHTAVVKLLNQLVPDPNVWNTITDTQVAKLIAESEDNWEVLGLLALITDPRGPYTGVTAEKSASLWINTALAGIDTSGKEDELAKLHTAITALLCRMFPNPWDRQGLTFEELSDLMDASEHNREAGFLLAGIKGQRLTFPRPTNFIKVGFMDEAPAYPVGTDFGIHYAVDLIGSHPDRQIDNTTHLYGMGYGEVIYYTTELKYMDDNLGFVLDVLYKNVICRDGSMIDLVVKYAHLEANSVVLSEGGKVTPSRRRLATMGDTGEGGRNGLHLHLEVIKFEQDKEDARGEKQMYPTRTLSSNTVKNMLNPFDVLYKAKGMTVEGDKAGPFVPLHKGPDGKPLQWYSEERIGNLPTARNVF